MKKRGLILFGIFLIFVAASYASAVEEAYNVSGNLSYVTAYATSQPVRIGVRVIGTPSLFIFEPENASYITNESLPLNYSVSDDTVDVWYTIDGSAPIPSPNLTSSLIFFNTSDGFHVLNVYANNSLNLTVKTVSFVANSTWFIILYKEDYKTNYSGASTDFYRYPFERLNNLGDIILENINHGMIHFNSSINVTNDRISNDNFVNIEGNINISFNKISLNRYELPNFNISATLWLYNLNFTNPRILKDNTVCPYYACPIEDYTDGVLRFKVSKFSNYSAEETPEGQVIIIGGGGGGGGGGVCTGCGGGGGMVIKGVDLGKYFCGLVLNETADGGVYCGRCRMPYMLRGTDCCLDENQNKICDVDEKAEVETPQKQIVIGWEYLNLLLFLILLALLVYLLILLAALFPRKKEKIERCNVVLPYEGRKVYSKDGKYIGKVEGVLLEDKNIKSWKVSVRPEIANNIKRDTITVRHSHIHSMKDVVILDAKASEYLEKLSSS